MKIVTATLLFLLSNGTMAFAEDCPAKGEPVQWIADYCMAKGQTDDLEVVRPCIDHASSIAFRSDCTAKLYFKQRLCEVLLPNSSAYKSVEQCVNDPSFSGSTVKNNGTGS